ncbi:hypothetical protein OC846_006128 [Tilletia horrida]|uniref:BRCT domain-containing protein n=1 Tax=Tilletia horrida TaxID=155126 RepID=A0AAN6GK11_9BASI|nr:hypothetical protein OC846_006128 [Tilletia horrida]
MFGTEDLANLTKESFEKKHADLVGVQMTEDSTDPLDLFEDALLSIFDERMPAAGNPGQSIKFSHPALPTKDSTITYQIPDVHAKSTHLFAHHQWDSGVLLARMIASSSTDAIGADSDSLRYPAADVRAQSVVELGAGTGLPGLVSSLLDAQTVLITDYDDPALITTISSNVKAVCPGRSPSVIEAKGLTWNTRQHIDAALSKTQEAEGFSRVLAADTLWVSSAHVALLQTMRALLRKDAQSRILLLAGFHTGRPAISRFLQRAAGELSDDDDAIKIQDPESDILIPDWEDSQFGGIWERHIDGTVRPWQGVRPKAWLRQVNGVHTSELRGLETAADEEMGDIGDRANLGDIRASPTMNRSSRVHKSTKIPNVKLRPATSDYHHAGSSDAAKREAAQRQSEREDIEHYRSIRRAAAGASSSRRRAISVAASISDDDHEDQQATTADLQDDDEDEDDDEDFGRAQVLPLANVVLCFSSISDDDRRVDLTHCASQLGARIEADLREDVHYLICDRVGSAKYYQAVEHGKFIVKPSWLEDIQKRYHADLPFEWVKLLNRHRLNALEGLHLMFSGFKGDKRRMMETAEKLGAAVTNELRQDNGVTHIISNTDEGPEGSLIATLRAIRGNLANGTMQNQAKIDFYNSLRIVWGEWLDDCEQADAALQETLYCLWNPKPTIQQRSEMLQKIRSHQLSGGAVHPCLAMHQQLSYTSIQHGNSQAHGLRSDLAPGSSSGARRKPPPALSSMLQPPIPTVQHPNARETRSGGQRGPVQDSVQQSNIMNQRRSTKFEEGPRAERLPSQPVKRKAADMAEVFPNGRSNAGPSKIARIGGTAKSNPFAPGAATVRSYPVEAGPHTDAHDSISRAGSMPRQTGSDFFNNYRFRIKLPNAQHAQSAKDFLESYGAIVLGSRDRSIRADYTLVPIFYPHEPAPWEGELVTKLFIERCEIDERVLPLSTSFGLRPSPFERIEGASDLVVCLAGFNTDDYVMNVMDSQQAERVITEAGGRVIDTLNRKTCTHLLCTDMVVSRAQRSNTYDAAVKAGIPTVGLSFLRTLLEKGVIEPPCRRTRSRSELGRSHSDTSILIPTQSESVSHMAQSDLDSPVKHPGLLQKCSTLASICVAWTTAGEPDKKLLKQACAVGIKTVRIGDPSTTHLLHKGAFDQECAKGQTARSVHLVHPEWLRACLATGAHADETLYPADLGRVQPLAEATQRQRSAPPGDMPVNNVLAVLDEAAELGGTAPPSPMLTTVVNSSGTSGQDLEEAERQAFLLAFPDTCGETARMLAGLNADLGFATGSNGAAGSNGGVTLRKMRPQRALGRTTSNGSAGEREPRPPPPVTVEPDGEGAVSTGISQINFLSETPPVPAVIGYEDNTKKERAKLLAALQREGMVHDAEVDPVEDVVSTTPSKGRAGAGSSKHRVQARRQPGTRH